jgi:hypothetical protein
MMGWMVPSRHLSGKLLSDQHRMGAIHGRGYTIGLDLAKRGGQVLAGLAEFRSPRGKLEPTPRPSCFPDMT